jgi:enoyl-CoA hydratase/carnithine racemase
MIIREIHGPIATLVLNDPGHRNAMGSAMFDALEGALDAVTRNDAVHIVLFRGEGNGFCAGFDLAAAAKQPELIATFILRLSKVNRMLRTMPQVVVAAVQGAAIAGGCAILSACDFVFAAQDAKLGYPVHRIGVSPAVTINTLSQAIGEGAARSLLMGGELIDADEAKRLGLVSHVSATAESCVSDAMAHCRSLASKGVRALRVTKAWLNELDGSLDETRFNAPAAASAQIASSDEMRTMLTQWNSRQR